MTFEAARVLEGTWEELLTYADELRGHRLRVIVLPSPPAADDATPEIPLETNSVLRQGAMELLKAADATPRDVGKSAGDPYEEALAEILTEKYRKIGLKL